MRIPVALQLYTVRDRLELAFHDTLEAVARSGFEAVEFFGDFYGRMPAGELRAALDLLGLVSVGATLPKALFPERLDCILEYHQTLGSKYLATGARCESADEWARYACSLNAAGEKCEDAGVRLCYHNHDHEFTTYDGKYALDIMLENTERRYVGLELDTYWAQYAQVNPLLYMERRGDRISLLHQKDMRSSDRSFCPIGEGIMDIHGIYRKAETLGVKWFILEQDICEGASVLCAEKNLSSLRTILEGEKL